MTYITFFIAVAGFLMSLATWIKDFITQRVCFSGRITQLHSHPSKNQCFFYLILANKSRLGISITDICISQCKQLAHCIPNSMMVSESTRRIGKEVISRNTECSTNLPIYIPGLGSASIIALFADLPERIQSDATSLNLVIYTNRGKSKKMKLELPQGWADQNRFS